MTYYSTGGGESSQGIRAAGPRESRVQHKVNVLRIFCGVAVRLLIVVAIPAIPAGMVFQSDVTVYIGGETRVSEALELSVVLSEDTKSFGQMPTLYVERPFGSIEFIALQRSGGKWTATIPRDVLVWMTFSPDFAGHVTRQNLYAVCSAFSEVENLGLDISRFTRNSRDLREIHSRLPRLRGLRLESNRWEEDPLESVQFEGLGNSLTYLSLGLILLNDDHLAELIDHCRDLETLSLIGCSGAGKEVARSVRRLSRLRTLGLSKSRMNAKALSTMLENPTLREFVLYGRPDMSEAEWRSFLKAARSLTGLGLECHGLSDEIVVKASSLPNLNWLALRRAGSIPQDVLVDIASSREWKGLQFTDLGHNNRHLMSALASLQHLQWLDLTSSAVSGGGLVMLQDARALMFLDLGIASNIDQESVLLLVTKNPELAALFKWEWYRGGADGVTRQPGMKLSLW